MGFEMKKPQKPTDVEEALERFKKVHEAKLAQQAQESRAEADRRYGSDEDRRDLDDQETPE